MTNERVTAGQTFNAGDGGIEVKVMRTGNSKEKAIFEIKNLKADKASYTIIVKRASGAESDRIQYETDNPNNIGHYELSADETTDVELFGIHSSYWAS